jgi:hypothetical protein
MNGILWIRKYFLIFFGVLLPLVAESQNYTAFIGKFEHQCPTPVAFPDYLQAKDFTDSLLFITKTWLKDRFQIQTADHKRIQPIAFSAYYDEPMIPKIFASTDYDYLVNIVTQLESAEAGFKMTENQARLRIQVEVYDRNMRRTYHKKTKIDFVIRPIGESMDEARISEDDFRRLYKAGLLKGLGLAQEPKTMAFSQAPQQSLDDFRLIAQKIQLQTINRGVFEATMGDSTLRFSCQLGAPYTREGKFERSAEWVNPLDGEKYEFSAELLAKSPGQVTVEIKSSGKILGRFRAIQTVEELLMNGKYENTKIQWTRHAQTLKVKAKRDTKLQALAEITTGSIDQDAHYTLWLAKSSKPAQTAFFNIWMADNLLRALWKYYEIEKSK